MERQILLIGIGQTGCTVAKAFSEKICTQEICPRIIACDTDEDALSGLSLPYTVSMTDKGDLGSVVEALDAEKIKTWFPCDYEKDASDFIKTLDMQHGSNQWRTKAMLAFAAYMANPEKAEHLRAMLADLTGDVELYVAASLAGGTGAGLCLPITLYIKETIQQNGGRVVSSHAFLAMPAICEHTQSAEQKVKSYANAYAALRELHTVNLTTRGAGGRDGYTPIQFTVGTPDGVPALLFDANRPEYGTPERAPFDKTFLFERVPGVTSVRQHADIIADVIASFCAVQSEAAIPTNTTAVYGSVSLTKVVYPVESIIEYITKQQVYNLTANELGIVHGGVMAHIQAAKADSKLWRGKPINEPALYAETYADIISRQLKENGNAQCLLGRVCPEDVYSDTLPQALSNIHIEALQTLIDSTFACDITDTVTAILAEDDEWWGDTETRRTTEEKKEHFFEIAARVCEALLDLYRHGVVELYSGKDAFEERLFAAAPDAGFSVIECILKDNGVYLHPTYALGRLCRLYNTVSATLVGSTEFVPEHIEAASMPEWFLYAEHGERGKTKYAKAGYSRLAIALSDPNTLPPDALQKTDSLSPRKRRAAERANEKALVRRRRMIADMRDDRERFHADIQAAVNRIQRLFSECRLRAVQGAVAQYTERYRAWLSSVSSEAADVLSDVKLCALRGSRDNGNVVNVGASLSDKERLWQAYRADYASRLADVAADDAAFGELFCRTVFSGDAVPNGREPIKALLAAVEQMFDSRLRAAPFYAEQLDKNIAEVILNDRTGEGTGRLFAGRNIPLIIGSPAKHADKTAIYERTVAVLPEVAEQYIQSTEAIVDTEGAQAFVEQMMFRAGEYCGAARFAPYMQHNQMYIRKEICGMPLYMVDAVNESSACCTGYISYNKARMHAKQHMTPMWDSHLEYRRGTPFPMPYISECVQKQYEGDVCRALLYARMTGAFCITPLDGVGDVYTVLEGGKTTLMCIGETPVLATHPTDVMLWAYGNPVWTEAYAAKCNTVFSRLRDAFPNFREDAFACTPVSSLQHNADLLSFARALADWLVAFAEAKMLVADSGITVLAKTASDTVLDFCLRNEERFNEVSAYAYNTLCGVVEETLRAATTPKKAKSALNWLHEMGCFVKYVFPTGFCQYGTETDGGEAAE